MKFKFILLLFLAVTVLACDKVEDATTVDFETTLEVDIPITAEAPNAVTKSAGDLAVYSFSGSEIVSLTEDDDLADYVSNIKSIELQDGAVLVFYGIIDGDEIGSLEFIWGYSSSKTGDYQMEPAIELNGAVTDLSKGTISFPLDTHLPALLNVLEEKPEYFYKIMLRGTANFDPSSTARMIAPVKLEASPL